MAIRPTQAWLMRPQDPTAFIFFRSAFGLLMFLGTIRFVAYGWVHDLLIKPDYHFTYFGFRFITVLAPTWLYVIFIIMGLSAFFLSMGIKTKTCALVFFVCFTWVELMEKAMYLNHYYLVSLIAFLLFLLPSHRSHSLIKISKKQEIVPIPHWVYLFLRLQIALVYFYAGFAKLNSDWLLYAQPLHLWLQNYSHWPIVGSLLHTSQAAFFMSWAGAAFDLTIWIFLWWPKTRGWAYTGIVIFHVSIWALFPIGIFSWLMILSATLFFAPTWPRHYFKHQLPLVLNKCSKPLVPWKTLRLFLLVWLTFQILFPLRFLCYAGPVNWTEEGFRFSWRVMLIEKTGKIEYRIKTSETETEIRIYPRKQLAPFQYKMLCTQWDMILEYAHHLKNEFENKGHQNVSVFADSFVSLNGRKSQRGIDPKIDLTTISPDSWVPRFWVLPLGEDLRQ